MAIKKRKSSNIKTLRNAQNNQHPHSSNDPARLKPENVGGPVHDESDILSYRAYLTQNLIKASEMMDILTTQNIRISKILPPPIYRNFDLKGMKKSIELEKENIDALKTRLQSYRQELPPEHVALKDLSEAVSNEGTDTRAIERIQNTFMSRFGKHLQDDRIVFHHQKFPQLRGDPSQAPADYWAKRGEILAQQREETLRLKALRAAEEQEELRRRSEEQERLRQKQEEQKLFEDPFAQQQQQQSQPVPGVLAYNGNSNQSQQQPTDPSQQGMLGSIFGDVNGENFNNGFEDEFGDLDTAFF
ncbi:LAME_0H16710g1_1 [Lachancea meyersii CBS 8951]|uniref:LAME_0H16710g1_1 n=1 Tax=Lachancea meyersii CBS 8951 TaxID=1266667 RepID=A0A1G4KI42_9SACH|nr:LAME_0H16710g1_1 [Lachancea meyersii CBS 8951]